MNLALITVGNIIRNYKKYGNSTANLPKNGRLRKINQQTSRWISRKVQINPFITRSDIKTDLEGAGINVSKDTISGVLYHTGFHSRSPRKVPLLKTKHVKDRLKFVKTFEKKNMQFWEKGMKWKLNYSEGTQWQVFGEKMALPSRSMISFPPLSLGVVSLWYGDAFHPKALVSYKLSLVE